jgi:hypothetical protein
MPSRPINVTVAWSHPMVDFDEQFVEIRRSRGRVSERLAALLARP